MGRWPTSLVSDVTSNNVTSSYVTSLILQVTSTWPMSISNWIHFRITAVSSASSGEDIHKLICENLRHNLNLIKNYEKPSIVKESNALYLRYKNLLVSNQVEFKTFSFLLVWLMLLLMDQIDWILRKLREF